MTRRNHRDSSDEEKALCRPHDVVLPIINGTATGALESLMTRIFLRNQPPDFGNKAARSHGMAQK
jgi:hypothetical protein